MNLSLLKSSVDIIEIAAALGLQLDKNHKCLCPFHDDKTASLQFSREKQIATCFSSNCDVGTMDVIGLVQKYKNWEFPQTIEWLSKQAGMETIPPPITIEATVDYASIFKQLESQLKKSSKAKGYLRGRQLNPDRLEVGYNTGRIYQHLKYCVAFPLKNKNDEVVSLYGRSTMEKAKAKHFYTKNRKGLYPCYPKSSTQRLVLTESIIDAISLEQHFLFSEETTTTLALYGTNGWDSEHEQAIETIKDLNEIILWMDGDEAGIRATERYTKILQTNYPNIKLSIVDMLEGEDINSLLESHEPEIYKHLFENRRIIPREESKTKEKTIATPEKAPIPNQKPTDCKLVIKKNYAVYENEQLKIELMGRVDTKDLSRLKVTMAIHNSKNKHLLPSRNQVDLYYDDQVEKLVRKAAIKIEVGRLEIIKAIEDVTRQLQDYRLSLLEKETPKTKERYTLRVITEKEKATAIDRLKNPNLTQILQEKLTQTGVIGESKNALFLLVILNSRKSKRPLNAMVQGTSGSGKSHLIKKTADCMYDQNKIKRFTRVTNKSFYNYQEYALCHCCIILEDYDGLGEEAELAWRELQTNDVLASSVSVKNEQTGEIGTGEKYVYGPIASIVATTHFRIYEDNESRVFVIAIDESEEQTERVLEYMAKKASKEITDAMEQAACHEIQNMMAQLIPYKVKNPYRLSLPKTTHHRRRLTQMLHDYIEEVTVLHQYQRQKIQVGNQELLVTELEDVRIAVDLIFNSIVLKTDELDGILRQFYEDLKSYIESKGKEYEFTQREVRQHFRVSKSQMQRYMKELEELEYIQRTGIGARNVHKYKISYWDNIEKLRQELKAHLYQQIEAYKNNLGR